MRTTRHWLWRLVHHRPRLMMALAGGLLIGIVMPGDMRLVTRMLIGWNAAIWSYLMTIFWLMIHADHARVRAIAEREEQNAVFVLALLSCLAIASLAAIVFELTGLPGLSASQRIGHYLFAGATLLGSWCMVATMFTFHYAHLFYNAKSDVLSMRFPDGETQPDYWDFLYFSFTIAVAAQTADISLGSRAMRKTVLAQSVLSFLFNSAIIGLSINIAAGLVSS